MERISFELSELQAFVATAQTLNFKAAATKLGISQPALSRRIDKLEEAIGTRLFERTTRRVALSKTGVLFLEHARLALEELEEGLQGIDEGMMRSCGHVSVACISSLSGSFLPQILQGFAEANPQIRLRIIDEGAQHVLTSVMSGSADFGLNFIGAQQLDIEFQPIYNEEYCLAVHKDHPLAHKKVVDWKLLAGERFIGIAKSSGNRILIDNALASLTQRPSIFYETNHVSGALSLVNSGLGVSAVPSLALHQHSYPLVRAVCLKNPSITRVIGLISRKGKTLSPAAQRLYTLLQDYMRRLKEN